MSKRFLYNILCAGALLCSLPASAQTGSNVYGKARLMNEIDSGYRGLWYHIDSGGEGSGEYLYKYSGGLGTYPSNHYPFSVYVPGVRKTFFCFGGTDSTGQTLYHEVSYFDHVTGKVPRPTIVLDKATNDAHDNPVIQVDREGYIWIFSTSHGTGRPSFIHRSVKPYDITRFEYVPATKMVNGKEVLMNNFSYLQMYYTDSDGFLGLFTHYDRKKLINGMTNCRDIAWMTSKDGIHWSEWKDLADIQQGHYQTSGQQGRRVGTSFNYHPDRKVKAGLDYRTNLYYLQTDDFGKTWKTVNGNPVGLPLTAVTNAALVHDYAAEGLNVYICDVNFDESGNPVILYLTSKGPEAGPANGPRQWHTAWWSGTRWEIHPFTTSGNNYDMGSIYIEADGSWKIIAPTTMGPQPYNTGGEMDMWISRDKGKSWEKTRQLTDGSRYNHTYARRPVGAQPGFYALWADGNGREFSQSHLYFSDRDGNVFQLPQTMTSDFETPLRYKAKGMEKH
ncbi:MAG: BNR-4 repeat-containing protein [Bacteroidota bacterium]|nr:BNR-4 repeat-containing protein [Bacteroidota bacterium]